MSAHAYTDRARELLSTGSTSNSDMLVVLFAAALLPEGSVPAVVCTKKEVHVLSRAFLTARGLGHAVVLPAMLTGEALLGSATVVFIRHASAGWTMWTRSHEGT